MKKFTADFETAVWIEDETWVWAWATCEIGNEKNLTIGNNIDDFIEYCKNEKRRRSHQHVKGCFNRRGSVARRHQIPQNRRGLLGRL